jgi:glycosyltransferase involved in cell wall biosynthesis
MDDVTMRDSTTRHRPTTPATGFVPAASRPEWATRGVSVIIPAYGEEGAVAEQVRSVREILTARGITHEIIVVDDGSTDATAARAVEARARVLQHVENRGYGASLKTGINAALYETIVITDADGTYPSDRIPDLLEALETADMAVGARTGAHVKIPLIRKPAKWLLGLLANRIAGRKIPDLNSGLRAFRRDTARQYFTILSDKFSFTTTITLSFMADDYRVAYVPIDYFKRIGKSKITPRHFMDFSILVLRMAMLFQPLRVFLPLGIWFGTVGVLKAIYDVVVFLLLSRGRGVSQLYAPVLSTSAMLLLMIALQAVAVGLVADGVIRRILQQSRALVPSRAVRVVEHEGTPAPDGRGSGREEARVAAR